MSRDDPSPEMRQRDYGKGDMNTPVSHSSYHGHSSSRDKDYVKRPDRSDRDSKTSSSSRSSREYDHETLRGKDKPLPPTGDSGQLRRRQEDRKDRSDDRGPHHSSRPYPDSSKGRLAPPQATVVDLDQTRAEFSRKDRDQRRDALETQSKEPIAHDPLTSKQEGTPPAAGDQKGSQDVSTKAGEDLTDVDMEAEDDYKEARVMQEAEDEAMARDIQQTEKDRAIAIAAHEAELLASKGAQRRRHEEPDSDSESESDDEPTKAAQAAASQGITSKVYSFIAGGAPTSREDEARHWKKEYKRAYQAYQESQHNFHKKEKESQHYHDQCYKWYMEAGALTRRCEMMDQERKALAAELGHTKQQLSDAITLSEVRGKELKGAQVFLTKADSLSVSDVVQKVSALNEEIFQAGALLAETLTCEPIQGSLEEHARRRQDVINEKSHLTEKILGSRLTDTLANESMKPQEGPANQLLVQIVLIIALTRWCASNCRGWTTNDRETNDFLDDLYDGIRKAEDQAVAGRWRSLTRAHIGLTSEGWSQEVMRGIISIMTLAGWTTSPEDLAQFEKRLTSIFKALREVRKATGEDVTSADLEVYAMHRGDDFDAATMEDSYGDDRSGASAQGGEKERVAGPSGLGLRKVIMAKTKEGGYQKRQEILSVPKVVLEKTVKEAIEPPPPPKSRRKKEKGEPGGGGIMAMVGLS